MYVYAHTHIYIYGVLAYLHTHICIYIHTHLYLYVYMYICISKNICMYTIHRLHCIASPVEHCIIYPWFSAVSPCIRSRSHRDATAQVAARLQKLQRSRALSCKWRMAATWKSHWVDRKNGDLLEYFQGTLGENGFFHEISQDLNGIEPAIVSNYVGIGDIASGDS